MRAIVDTNVFVSGIFWKGPPHRILVAWQAGRFKLVVSSSILEEYRRVLAELAVKYPGVQCGRLLELVELNAEIVSPIVFARPVCTDPDDDKFLGAAIAGGVGHIVSGDKALLKLNGYKDLQIIKPQFFLKEIP
jgi:putative PIN family toxin of toxin-antitoxin system